MSGITCKSWRIPFMRFVYVCLVIGMMVGMGCGRESVYTRATKEFEAGRYRETIFLIKHHFRRGGDRSPELLFIAGKAWLRLGSEAEAEDAFAECYSIDSTWAPKIAEYLREETVRSMSSGLTVKGKRILLQAISYEPGLDFGFYNAIAGEMLLARKDFDGAIHYFSRYLEEHADSAGAAGVMMNLATAYEGKGEIKEAIDLYRRFQDLYPKSRLKTTVQWKLENLLYQMSEEFLKSGDAERAESILVDLASAAGSPIARERANFLLGEISEARGDVERALTYYKEVVNLNLGSSSRLVEKAKERIEKLELERSRR